MTNMVKIQQTVQIEKIFVNGHIITMDETIEEVEALAISQGKIFSIGSTVMKSGIHSLVWKSLISNVKP